MLLCPTLRYFNMAADLGLEYEHASPDTKMLNNEKLLPNLRDNSSISNFYLIQLNIVLLQLFYKKYI